MGAPSVTCRASPVIPSPLLTIILIPWIATRDVSGMNSQVEPALANKESPIRTQPRRSRATQQNMLRPTTCNVVQASRPTQGQMKTHLQRPQQMMQELRRTQGQMKTHLQRPQVRGMMQEI